MRVALVDPASFTPPYDHGLAAALARRGFDVDLVTSPFAYDNPPAPDGYRRHELFLPLSSKLARRYPRSPLRLPLKPLQPRPSGGSCLFCPSTTAPANPPSTGSATRSPTP